MHCLQKYDQIDSTKMRHNSEISTCGHLKYEPGKLKSILILSKCLGKSCRIKLVNMKGKMDLVSKNLSLWFLTKGDSNQPAQLQRLARKKKFRL